MTHDLTDRVLGGWTSARPELEVEALQVTARLSRIGPLLARRQEAVFGEFGLGRGEVGALSALRIAGPPHRLSPTRLGKGLMLSSAGVTSRIDRLERRGLVRRLPDPDDRRGVIVELTDKGLEVVDAAVAALAKSDRELLERLTSEEIGQLEVLLRKFLSALELPE
ncbi:MAG TPA: MarR family transcriptional regulator [Candidatus Limnocylindrales bacterium]|nr:MarR family transcriptional regulator [Candidatus Limnocylindrales bacterium]